MYSRFSFLGVVALIALLGSLTSCSEPLRKNLVPITDDEAGFFPGTFSVLDSQLIQEEERKEIPGGALVIRRNGQMVYSNVFGYTEPGGGERILPGTLFDVASLTKPLAGVPAAVMIHPPGVNHDQVWTQRLVNLMSHTSNVYDEEKYEVMAEVCEQIYDNNIDFREKNFKSKLEGMIRIRNWEDPCYQYSNSGYIVLGLLTANQFPLMEKELHDRYWVPLGAKSFTYHPNRSRSIAMSGKRESGDKIIGRPYDPIADMLVSSKQTVPVHSGLFATASDVARIIERLQGNNLPDLRHQQWADWLFTGECEYPICDDPDSSIFVTTGGLVCPVSPPYGDPGGRPGRYFMKTGYTGCLLWVDRKEGITVALLTNGSADEFHLRWEEFAKEIIETIKKGS